MFTYVLCTKPKIGITLIYVLEILLKTCRKGEKNLFMLNQANFKHTLLKFNRAAIRLQLESKLLSSIDSYY